VKYHYASEDWLIICISLLELLKVFALFEIRVIGSLCPTNHLKAKKSCPHSMHKSCTAQVDAQVKRHTIILFNSPAFFAYIGPAKSRPVWANGGSSDA